MADEGGKALVGMHSMTRFHGCGWGFNAGVGRPIQNGGMALSSRAESGMGEVDVVGIERTVCGER